MYHENKAKRAFATLYHVGLIIFILLFTTAVCQLLSYVWHGHFLKSGIMPGWGHYWVSEKMSALWWVLTIFLQVYLNNALCTIIQQRYPINNNNES